jgi:methylated-DNA-[protein]-cysteine S-methyltransferase
MRSPIGVLTIKGNDDAVTGIKLPGSASIRRPAPADREVTPVPAPLAAAVAQLKEYFAGDRTRFDLVLELSGTPFQRAVWLTLKDIPYGETVSYAELARMVGRPKAVRAVGQANGANPVPIVLPCHRVVASGGAIGGYGGGPAMKRSLLALEGAPIRF